MAVRAMFSDTVQQIVLDVSARKIASPLDGITVTVYKLNEDGTKQASPATIYTHRTTAGATKANPFTTVDGGIEFYADPGGYSIDLADTIVPARIAAKSIHFEALPATDGAIPASALPEYGRALAPTGTVLPFAGTVAPSGWLMCDGAKLQRAGEAALFAVIGTAYNLNNGTESGTEFRLPDLRGRSQVGTDDMGSGAAGRLTTSAKIRGASGGAEFHTLSAAETALKGHDHSISGATHSHGWNEGGNPLTYSGAADGELFFQPAAGGSGHAVRMNSLADATPAIDSAAAVDTAASSGHNNMQPYQVFNFIIKK